MKTPRPDKHHILWERAWYTTDRDQALREQHLLIPRLDYDIHHNGLHKAVDAPPKPSPDMILGATAVVQALPYYIGHVEALKQLTGYFDKLASNRSTPEFYADLADRIAENLFSQLHWVKLGLVPDAICDIPQQRDHTMEDFGRPVL